MATCEDNSITEKNIFSGGSRAESHHALEGESSHRNEIE